MPKQQRNLMDIAYAEIKRRIITLELRPGQRLDDYQLSAELNFSRTPVREAIFLLAAEGLVDIRSRAGFTVRPLDLLDIAHLFEAHLVLAKALARLAAARVTSDQLVAMELKAAEVAENIARRNYLGVTAANADLHRLEAAATNNEIIQKMADSVHDQGQRLAYLCFGGVASQPADLGRHFEEVTSHHTGMIDALRRRDARTAERIAVDHVGLFKRRVQRFLDADEIDGFRLTAADLRAVAFPVAAPTAPRSRPSAH